MDLKEATIRVVDFETTGFDPESEKVCEVGYQDIIFDEPDDDNQQTEGWILYGDAKSFLCNPGIPIPYVSSAIHHITDADVEGKPTPEEVFPKVFNDEPNLFAAHNAEFDESFARAYGVQGSAWLCTYRLALHRLPDALSFKNQALRYMLGFTSVAGDAHRAGHDAKVTALILCYMLNGSTTKMTVEDLVAYAERPVFMGAKKMGFGKHKDALWTECPKGYLQWMQKQGEKTADNKDGWDRDQWYTLNRVLAC